MNTVNTLAVAKQLIANNKASIQVHIVRNEIALCLMHGNITWMMSKYYPLATAPKAITKHIA
jgi:hypothetical protein